MAEFIRGTCFTMCPEKERCMREKAGLLHRFEMDDDTKHWKRPKADPSKMIKCYSRPAAGQIMTDSDQLRPGPVLALTIKYLFTKIVTQSDVDWAITYNFVFDRLRSIRQDIIIQRIGASTSIQIFEPIIRFLVYAWQRMCERSISEFDPKINNQHLLECLKHLLNLYDELEEVDASDLNASDLDLCMDKLAINNNRPEMEAIYILLHIGDPEALKRALNLPLHIRESPEIRLATKISLAWYLKNYVRVCSLIQRLPPILICVAALNLRKLRRTALKIMSAGYSSKVLTFPGLKLQEILLYRDIAKLKADCELFGLTFTNENVQFQKANFKDDVAMANVEMYYTVQALHDFLPQILLGPV